jgi:hypothetical protein
MVRSGGTGSLGKAQDMDDLRGGDEARPEPAPAAEGPPKSGVMRAVSPTSSGAMPAVPRPAPANATQSGGLRAPLRPTGRQGTPAAQRPATAPRPGAAPGAAPPPAEGGEGKPKIQRGFDFS